MYVRTEKHINAHILCCVIALIMIRLIQFKLDKNEKHMSVERIIKALRDCSVMASKDSDGTVNYARISSFADIYSNNHKKRTAEEIMNLLDSNNHMSDRDIILNLFGADIPRACKKHAFEKAFGKRFKSDEAMIGKVNFRLS